MKTKFNLIVLLIFTFISIIPGCKKTTDNGGNNGGSENSISARIDTSTLSFNYQSGATYSAKDYGLTDTYYDLAINGYFDSTEKQNIEIQLNSTAAITKGIYTENDSKNILTVSYSTKTGGTTYKYSQASSVDNPFILRITSFDENILQGTFEGDIYLNGDITQEKKNLANASFTIITNYIFSNTPTPTTIKPGDRIEGGIVIYTDLTNKHGLVCAPKDQQFARWDNNLFPQATGAIGFEIGDGSINTTKIINKLGAGSYAAFLARQYNGGEYSDWFLPSVNELKEMYINRNKVGNLSYGSYWSSTDDSNGYYNDAYDITFAYGGGTFLQGKGKIDFVRAVRAF